MGGFVVLNTSKLLIAIAAITTIGLISGCICCCGLDSQLSKFKKSVSDISFPSQISIGGKTYDKVYSNEYLTPATVKSGIVSFLEKLKYPRSDTSALVSQYVDTSGVEQYKSFKYTDGTAKGTLGGLVAKTASPLVAMTGYTGMKSTADASMPHANNPNINWGGVQDFSYGGSATPGDGGDWYRFQVDGTDCYGVAVRYSNMYVLVYSFESYEVAEEAAKLAILQIDEAA